MNMPHFHMPHSLHMPKGQAGLTERLSKIEPPEFLADLYRDLRNRRLLPVAGVLIAATLAAPFALSSGGSTPAPPPASPAAVAKSPFGAAVVVANHGIRELSKRGLGSTKDPFRQQLQAISTAGSELGIVAASGPTSTVGSELGLSGAGDTVTGGSGSGSGGSGSGSGSGSGGGSDISGSGQTLSKGNVYAVNVQSGESGSELQSQKDVGYVAFLPSESKPVFVFVGVSQTGAKAFFLLPGALSLSGDADCLLPVKPAGCQLIAMKPGDTETVIYTGDGKTYKLKLDKITQVQAP